MKTLDLNFEALIRVTIRDAKGRIKCRTGWKQSKSYLKAFMEILFVQMAYITKTNCKDTGGTLRNVGYLSGNFDANATAGTTSHGIVIGTDSTAVEWDDYQLGALIPHGGGTGDMMYGASVFPSEPTNPTGNVIEFILQRTMTNDSGFTITVREAGVYIQGGSIFYFCGIRDVLDPQQAIPDGDNITIEYKLKVEA